MSDNTPKLSRRAFLKLAGTGLITAASLSFHQDLLAAVAKSQPVDNVFTPMNLNADILNQLLQAALSRGGDFSEVYAQQKINLRLRLRDGALAESDLYELSGLGVRVLQGTRSGYAYSQDFSEASLHKTAAKASPNISPTETTPPKPIEKRGQPQVCPLLKAGSAVPPPRKAEKLALLEQAARKVDPRITHVTVELRESSDYKMLANSHGIWVEDLIPLIWVQVEVIAQAGTKVGKGSWTDGAKMGYEFFDKFSLELIAQRAANQALANLEAVPGPQGEFPIVLSNRCGLIFQAIVGYELEGDKLLNGLSGIGLAKGNLVASPLLSVIDDATIANGFGSYSIDDEGIPPQRTVLIRLGKADRSILTHIESRQLRELATGSARREDHRFAPVASVSNTFVAQGITEPQELLREVSAGVYIASLANSLVRVDSKRFGFPVRQASLIENGKLTTPLSGLMVVGTVDQFLKNIDKIGTDLEFCPQFRWKNGQQLSVAYGMPSMRFKSLTLRRSC